MCSCTGLAFPGLGSHVMVHYHKNDESKRAACSAWILMSWKIDGIKSTSNSYSCPWVSLPACGVRVSKTHAFCNMFPISFGFCEGPTTTEKLSNSRDNMQSTTWIAFKSTQYIGNRQAVPSHLPVLTLGAIYNRNKLKNSYVWNLNWLCPSK